MNTSETCLNCRAYRKLSILVHPDKNPGDDARKAFEALNDAYRRLKDPSALEEVLRNQAGRIRAQQDRCDGGVVPGGIGVVLAYFGFVCCTGLFQHLVLYWIISSFYE